MTIQEKVQTMIPKLSHLKDSAPNNSKRWCFSLLHDALVYSQDKIPTMDPQSLVSFVELTAHSVNNPAPNPQTVQSELVKLGFWIKLMN